MQMQKNLSKQKKKKLKISKIFTYEYGMVLKMYKAPSQTPQKSHTPTPMLTRVPC